MEKRIPDHLIVVRVAARKYRIAMCSDGPLTRNGITNIREYTFLTDPLTYDELSTRLAEYAVDV